MSDFIELIKAVFLGIIQGITEWLPISSTGHMILFEEFFPFTATSEGFFDMFKVVIQLGSILSVIVIYFNRLNPFCIDRTGGKKRIGMKKATLSLWGKVIVGSVPAGIAGLLLDDLVDSALSGYTVVAAALVVYGIAFIVIERINRHRQFRISSVDDIDYGTAAGIGFFQVLSLIPGTSRSGSTILGASVLGVSRTAAAEFSFFLAVPIMFAASGYKLLKFGFVFTGTEIAVLLTGCVVAFLVSLVAIRFLISFVRRHSFEAFGWYRIALGALLAVYFLLNI